MPSTDSAESAWKPLRATSLTARIREEILRYVDAERLRPAQRLPSERELAAILGVSRPSVREAVRSLQSEGRLVVRHGQGVFVAEPAITRRLRSSLVLESHGIDELFAMREVLEVPAARWAAENQDHDALERVQDAFGRLAEASRAETPDFDALQRMDMEFHLRIVQASGNHFLEQTQGVLNDMLAEGMRTTLTVPGRMKRSRAEHERILAALLRGDGAAAANAARRHVRAAGEAAAEAVRA